MSCGIFGYVRRPQLIRSGADEVPLDQVSDVDPWSGSCTSPAIERQAGQASATHQQSHGVMNDSQPLPVDKLPEHELPAVSASGVRVDRCDHVRLSRVTYRARGG